MDGEDLYLYRPRATIFRVIEEDRDRIRLENIASQFAYWVSREDLGRQYMKLREAAVDTDLL